MMSIRRKVRIYNFFRKHGCGMLEALGIVQRIEAAGQGRHVPYKELKSVA